MMEPKPIASLSSGLLARKGAARPAMRRPVIQNGGNAAAVAQDDLGWNDMGYDVNPDQSTPMDHDHDSGFNPLANAVPEVKPEVRQQQERIAEQLQLQADELGAPEAEAAPEPAAAPESTPAPEPAPVVPIAAAVPQAAPVAQVATIRRLRAAPGSKGKSAFTLRLDPERHLKLRLACAVGNLSAQQLVTAAVDAYLESIPQISELAAQVPAKKQRAAE